MTLQVLKIVLKFILHQYGRKRIFKRCPLDGAHKLKVIFDRWYKPLFLLMLTTGCGYHWTPDFPNGEKPTISIAYAKGDDDGTLTSELIRTITASGIANVGTQDADFRLQIVTMNNQNQTVGYRRDKQKVAGKISKNIVACEGRRTLSAEITLFEGTSDKIKMGPCIITTDTDYDYVDGDSIEDLAFLNSDGIPTTVLPFSLGQLESIESAQEAATKPLYRKLAQEITNTLFAIW